MMRFVIGFCCGVLTVTAFLAFGPNGSERKAKAAGRVMTERAEELRVELCTEEFEQTNCTAHFSKEQCQLLLNDKCGLKDSK